MDQSVQGIRKLYGSVINFINENMLPAFCIAVCDFRHVQFSQIPNFWKKYTFAHAKIKWSLRVSKKIHTEDVVFIIKCKDFKAVLKYERTYHVVCQKPITNLLSVFI